PIRFQPRLRLLCGVWLRFRDDEQLAVIATHWHTQCLLDRGLEVLEVRFRPLVFRKERWHRFEVNRNRAIRPFPDDGLAVVIETPDRNLFDHGWLGCTLLRSRGGFPAAE